MSSRKTRSALLLSVMSMLLCIAMLAGSTFAWFTDTATSGSNRIVAGNLDVDLVMASSYNGEYTSIAGGTGDIFKAGSNANNTNTTLWEPGATHVAYLGVKNNGTLAFKYNVYIDVTDEGLADSLEYAIVPFGKSVPSAKIASWTAAKSATGVSTGTISKGGGRFLAAEGGCLDEIANGTAGETDYFALVVHMKEEAGNEYQGKSVTIDVNVVATQKNAESDSFDNTYDNNSTYPSLAPYINTTTQATVATAGNSVTITDAKATSTIPAAVNAIQIVNSTKTTDSTAKDNYQMAVDSKLTREITTTNATETSVTYDISYVYTEGTTSYDVSKFSDVVTNVIKLSAGLKDVKVTHTHGGTTTSMTAATSETANEDGKYYYNSETGKLTIWSSTYSAFEVTYKSEFVASIGSVGYNTLAEAFDAASAGDTINLLQNCAFAVADISTDKVVTIDSNGYTITRDTETLTNFEGNSIALKYFAGGTGTETAPFIISNATQMQNITNLYDSGYYYYKIQNGVATIDCTGWNPVYLNGSFDGNGVSLTNVTNNLFYIVGHQTITGTTKRVYAENLSIKNFSATFNIRNTATYAAGSMIKNIGTTGKVSFENISLGGYIESYWNAGSFFNYGPTNCNLDGDTAVYVGFSVDFKKCTSNATIVCTSGNVIGGMFGHPYTNGDNPMYLTYDNESGFTGKGYTTTSGCGLYGWGCYSYQKTGSGNTYAYINGVEAPTEHTLLTSQWSKIDKCTTTGSHGNGFTTTAGDGVTYIGITLGAQLTAYDSNNNKISSLAGITFVLNLAPINVTSGQSVALLSAFNSVEIINEDGTSGISDGVLKVYTGADTSYKAGTINLYVTQYTADGGTLVSANNFTIASSPANEDTLASPLTWTLY